MPGTLNDVMLAAVGGANLQDGLRAFYLAGGAVSGALNDLERQYLLTKVAAPGTNQDLWMKLFTLAGYTVGSYNDRAYQWWANNAGAFSPASLFAASEQGAWYDPSDLSSMFQDSAGVTPVTAVEQPVGKLLDKSGRGNHAVQATTAQKPILRARVNLLTKSEQFDNAAWTKSNATITANSTTDPLGGSTADTLTDDAVNGEHRVYQAGPGVLGIAFSCYLKAGTASFAAISVGSTGLYAIFNLGAGTVGASAGCTPRMVSAGNGWYRCYLEATTATASNLVVNMGVTAGNATPGGAYVGSGSTIYMWGAQMEYGSVAGPYQRIDTSTVYNTVGFKTYLEFDGVDDGMYTAAAINFSATDKMFLCVGQRIDILATAMIVELTANATGAGGFATYTDGNGEHVVVATTPNDYYYAVTVPKLAVVTSVADRSLTGAAEVSKRENAVAKTLALNTAGETAGNFANDVVYICRRNNTSLPLTGRIYQLVLRGAATSNADRDSTETYVNTKTGAY